MRVLFVENQDSFSWNVINRLPVERHEIQVVPNIPEAGERLRRLICDAEVLVIGPGPKDPIRTGLVDVARAALAAKKPLLGICLGHQALGLAYGARLTRSAPVHGKQSRITFHPSRLFPGMEGRHTVMRYHSLALQDVRPPLRVIASTAEGVPMAIEHEALPAAGLQFHPDSFGTPRGEEMLASFFEAIS